MQSADVKIIFPVVNDRSVMIPGNSIKSTNFTNKIKTKPPAEDIRRGKWTAEEEAYAIKLIEAFNGGLLELPEEEVANGLTLRAFLAQRLSCDPMRITKKFSGDYCLGKRNYHNAEYIDNQLLANMRNSLIIHEKSFKMKDVEIKKEKMYKEELERNKTHPVINYGHMVSSPAIDAMVLKTVSTGPSQSDSSQADNEHIHSDQLQGSFANMQNSWGETTSFARENEMKNNNSSSIINPVQIVQEYGYFYDIPAPQLDPSVTFATNDQYKRSQVDNQGAPFPSVTNNFNSGNTIGLNSPIDVEFTNGYGNIDFPMELNLLPTETGQSQTVITKNDSQMSIGLASNFSFSFDSTLGFSFMSTASLTSGLFPSTASLTGIMNAFSSDDANDSIPNAVVMDSVANVDNDDGVAPTERTKMTTRIATTDDHLQELSYNLSRSVSIKGELNTNSEGVGVEKRINMLTKAGKGSASFETSSDTASTHSSSSSTTSSKPHYLSQEPTPVPAAASTASSRSGLTPQSVPVPPSTLTSSGPPVFALDVLSGGAFDSSSSGTESTPMSPSTTRFSSFSTANASSSWKAGSLASVKRNRSVNERLNLDVPSVATSTESTALPLKMRRTTSASGLQVRDIELNTSVRRALYISLLHHHNKVDGIVRRSVSCSVLYDTWTDRRRGGRSSKNMLRSKSHNIVITKDIDLVIVEDEGDDDDDVYSRNELTSAICI